MQQLINKAAITLIPKEPFIKWVQSTDAEAAEIPDESILSYSRMYLVDDSLDGDDPEKLIKKNLVLPTFPWVGDRLWSAPEGDHERHGPVFSDSGTD